MFDNPVHGCSVSIQHLDWSCSQFRSEEDVIQLATSDHEKRIAVVYQNCGSSDRMPVFVRLRVATSHRHCIHTKHRRFRPIGIAAAVLFGQQPTAGRISSQPHARWEPEGCTAAVD
ncbi:MAG: hypothetical protein ACKVHE_02600 [Planctomycetales bacterium]